MASFVAAAGIAALAIAVTSGCHHGSSPTEPLEGQTTTLAGSGSGSASASKNASFGLNALGTDQLGAIASQATGSAQGVVSASRQQAMQAGASARGAASGAASGALRSANGLGNGGNASVSTNGNANGSADGSASF